MKKLLKEIGIRLLSIALVSLFLIAVSTIGSYLTGSTNNHNQSTLTPNYSQSYTFEQSTLTPTKPIVTPTPKPTPVLRDRLNPKQIEHVYFFYADTPADKEALKVAKLLSKYVNVTFCKVIANGSVVDLPLRKEYIQCAKALNEKFLTEIWDVPPFSTPSLIVDMKVKNDTEFLNKYDSDNFVNLGCSYKNEVPRGYLYYWGTNERYTVPISIDWFYAQITGKFLKPPAYAKRKYHSYDKEGENITALVLGSNYIPKPIKPLNPNDVKLIIFADMYGVNDDVKKPVIDKILKKLRQYIPNAKLIKLTYWWYPNGSITSDPPGYKDYYYKYVIPYAKYYDPHYGKWFLDFPCVILILKDRSHRTYGDTMSYKDYCDVIRDTGYSGCPYCIYPPIDRLFLDIQAYYHAKNRN